MAAGPALHSPKLSRIRHALRNRLADKACQGGS
jgi:hypothetical protein